MTANLYRKAAERIRNFQREQIEIQTRTSTKKINIRWIINKETVDIANMSPKGGKKGVIATSVSSGAHTFNLELCVPGWRRSQDGFSAFYLTVPRKKKHPEDIPNNGDFVARYIVKFGRNEDIVTRISTIRNDFDLGVGFPHFTETTTLIDAIYENQLVFNITVEIFDCGSVIKNTSVSANKHRAQTATDRLMSRMYNDKINGDVSIIAPYQNKNRCKRTKSMRVHKCILAASSPVFHKYFKEKQTSCILMKHWSAEIIMMMIKFLYLREIDLNHSTDIEREYEDEKDLDLDSLDCDIGVHDLSELEPIYKENKSEEMKCSEEDDEREALKKLVNKVSMSVVNPPYIECCDEVLKLFGLFEIAECYNMKELLIACCRKLQCYVTLETCCMFLAYLEKYNHIEEIKDTKSNILEFIHQNIKIIKSSPGYLYMLQNEPSLMGELIDKISMSH